MIFFQPKIPIIALLILLLTSFVFTQKVYADPACSDPSICAGTTAYLKVGACQPSADKAYCVNIDLTYNQTHYCPVGGGPGSCIAEAAGLNGCQDVPSVDDGTGQDSQCFCDQTGDPCTGNGTTCGTPLFSGYPGTCKCNVIQGISCGDPQPGMLGCCYTPATYCGDDICNGTETAATCPEDCGGAPTPAPSCPDGVCNGSETTATCPQDCPPPPPICPDGACNGSETTATCPQDCPPTGPICGDGWCEGSENCSNCSGDCGACSGCGDGVCQPSENCASCSADCGICNSPDFCGDSICSAGESCSTCESDCGACTDPGFCGDATCNAFETCSSCESDCGSCPSDLSWWQARGGSIYAARTSSPAIQSIVPGLTCSEPTCSPYLLALIQGLITAETDGVVITGGGSVQADGYYTPRNLVAIGARLTRYTEGYDFFYRRTTLGSSPTDQFAGQHGDAQKPVASGIYFSSQDTIIQQPWTITAGESYIIFVDGTLTFQDPTNVGSLITVEEGGFIAFIANADIIIDQTVGHADPASTTPNLEGIYVADDLLTVAQDGDINTADRRFIGAGTFVGWGGVDLQRDLDANGGGTTYNQTIPAETFIYRPDLLFNTPEEMLSPHSIWQEVN